MAEDIKRVVESGVEVCLVIGGGNIFRGVAGAAKGMERASADYMGMLATVMNALAMQDAPGKHRRRHPRAVGHPDGRRSASPTSAAAPLRHLEKGRVVIFAAGTGNPFFTTDTAAALRAAEMDCDALFKGTSVDGVYTADPKKDPAAKRYDTLELHGRAGQGPARSWTPRPSALMRDNNIPIVVFSIQERGNLLNVLKGEGVCTPSFPASRAPKFEAKRPSHGHRRKTRPVPATRTAWTRPSRP